MEETSGSEKLLPSFNNCIELEPHNFTTSEPIEEDEVNAEEKAQDLVDKAQEEHDEEVVTDRIDPETKDEIKKTLKREPVQVEGGTEKKVKNEDGNDKQEGDVDMKKENIIEEEAVIEKVEFSTAPNTPAATEGASNEESKMDLDWMHHKGNNTTINSCTHGRKKIKLQMHPLFSVRANPVSLG